MIVRTVPGGQQRHNEATPDSDIDGPQVVWVGQPGAATPFCFLFGGGGREVFWVRGGIRCVKISFEVCNAGGDRLDLVLDQSSQFKFNRP